MKKTSKFLFLSCLLFISCHLGAQSYDVVWTDLVNMTESGNELTKNGPYGWNAGASSVNLLPVGADGWVEYTVPDVHPTYGVTHVNFGLSAYNYTSNPYHTQYSFTFVNGNFKVLERATPKTTNAPYSPNDVFKIERIDNTVFYYQNDSLIYESIIKVSSQLIVDVTAYYNNTFVGGAEASFDIGLPDGDISNVVWTDMENIVEWGNSIVKNQGGYWTGGAASSNSLPVGEAGYVEFTVTEHRAKVVGLSEVNTNAGYGTIDYAIYAQSTGKARALENGSGRGPLIDIEVGDVLRIERYSSGIIEYKRNDVAFYTSGVNSTTSLLVDFSIHYTHTILNNVVFSADTPPPPPPSGDISNYVELKKKLDGSSYPRNESTKILPVTYIEEYAIVDSENDTVDFSIYNWKRQVVDSGTLVNEYGVNWHQITTSNLVPNSYYVLEVTGPNKGETYYLRFEVGDPAE